MGDIVNYKLLRYRINYYLARVPVDEYLDVLLKIPDLLGISPDVFHAYYLASSEQMRMIPIAHLMKLAEFFSGYFNENIGVEDLIDVSDERKTGEFEN